MDIYICEPVSPFHTAALPTNNFTTKQNVAPSPLPVIPGAKLRIGSKLSIRAHGDFSTTGTPNLTLGFWFGTSGGTITGDIALSSAITTGSGAAAWPWVLEWEGICIGTGTAGSLLGSGFLVLGTSLTAFATPTPIPVTAALRTVSSFDTTIERAIGVSATWSAASASNQVTVNSHRALILN